MVHAGQRPAVNLAVAGESVTLSHVMISIPIRSVVLRLTCLLVVVAALGWLGWTITRAALGESLSRYVGRSPDLANEARLRGADTAAQYAAQDPMCAGNAAAFIFAHFGEPAAGLLRQAVAELHAATQASPNHYRSWLTLGHALERNGALNKARAAFQRAVNSRPSISTRNGAWVITCCARASAKQRLLPCARLCGNSRRPCLDFRLRLECL